MEREELVEAVAAHLGATPLDTDRACQVVLGAFAGWLSPAERQLFADEIPASFGAAFESQALPLEEQLLSQGLTVGHAREVVASVCHVLGEQLSEDVLVRLRRVLPAWIAAYLVGPAAEASPLVRDERRSEPLSEGQPGSHHAISEARADRTQSGSVAAANPHGDAKLSSALGTTQLREHETLAEGHPAMHPIGTARG